MGKNNSTVALNLYYVKKINIYPACISKHNLSHENQIIPLMIPNRRMALSYSKKISALLRGIRSKHDGDFCSLIVIIRLEQKANMNLMKKYVKINIFVML